MPKGYPINRTEALRKRSESLKGNHNAKTVAPFIRFQRNILIKDNGCWIWQGAKLGKGYGCFHVGGKRVYTHRFAYEYFIGPIPRGLELDHLCRNRDCVNPWHLEPVAHAVNIQRGDNYRSGSFQRNKTHCPQGHPYNEENTIYRSANRVNRHCRICSKEASKKWREK